MAIYNPNITGRSLKQTASTFVGAISYPDQVALFEADKTGTGADFAEKIGGLRTELDTMASSMSTTTYCDLFKDILY